MIPSYLKTKGLKTLKTPPRVQCGSAVSAFVVELGGAVDAGEGWQYVYYYNLYFEK